MKSIVLIICILFVLVMPAFCLELPRYVSFNKRAGIFPALEIDNGPNYVSYIFADEILSEKDKLLLLETGRDFQRLVYDNYYRHFKHHSKRIGIKKVFLLFDRFENKKSRSMVMREYLDDYGLSVINIDIDSLKDSRIKLTLVHEMQHLINNIYRKDDKHYEEDWINEGLSQFYEYYFSRLLPENSLKSFFKDGLIPSLISSPGDKEYTNYLLFMIYLYTHFGGESLLLDIMTSGERGRDNLENAIRNNIGNSSIDGTGLTKLSSMFLNYSMALWYNKIGYGEREFFSIGGQRDHYLLSSYHIKATKLLINKDEKVIDLKPFQTGYYKLHGARCFSVKADRGCMVYRVSGERQGIPERPVSGEHCLLNDNDREFILAVINPKHVNCRITICR